MKRFLLVIFALLMTITPALAQQTQQQTKQPAAPPKPIYIRAGRLFDATSDNVRENMVIVIVGDRIQSVGSASTVTIPSGVSVIDLSHATVLPGLIDCHTHLGARADRYEEIYNFKDTPFDSAFAGVVNARKTLEAGFTSVRD
ncbi:MAG TPA: amidohydrolase family protein [Candidatus Angelobacter sp.]|nr:amidohydrolase family protein [Candidatus Angelobacter sp.]